MISFHQGVRGSLVEWRKHFDEKVGIQKTGLKTLTGVVQKMKLDSTGKEETFGKAFEKLRKAFDGMKKKSNNIEKVILL